MIQNTNNSVSGFLNQLRFITFKHLSAPHDRWNLSFVEEILEVGEKMTRKGRKTAIYQSHKFWLSVSSFVENTSTVKKCKI